MQIENINCKMHKFISRSIESTVFQYLNIFPALAILGPRQCGKSTLIKMLAHKFSSFVYLDLQNINDLNKLSEPTLFFESNKEATICLDEIQMTPHIFSVLRSVIDKDRRNGRFILLGSASRELIQQTSETLAGRIGFIELTPFEINEIRDLPDYSLQKFWLRGGFPNSYLSASDEESKIWRDNFIRTFVERDIPQFGFKIPALQLRRFLQMCAHNHSQLLNSSKIGEAIGLSHTTIRNYIDLFENTFLFRTIQPYITNVRKRLVKSPKLLIRDSGIFHRLLSVDTFNDLLGHPLFGFSWEGFVTENIITNLREWSYNFYRTSSGDEIDLVLVRNNKIIAVECKASTSPYLGKGFWNAMEQIGPMDTYVIIPADASYLIKEHVIICGLKEFFSHVNKY